VIGRVLVEVTFRAYEEGKPENELKLQRVYAAEQISKASYIFPLQTAKCADEFWEAAVLMGILEK